MFPDDFVDEGHFSKKGGLKFAELVAQSICSKTDIISGGKNSLHGDQPDCYSATL